MPQQPDILFIVLDTLRRDRLSVYGHSVDTSPHLDTFAQKATLFERAVSPAQWTIPAHGSLFTGLYPGTHQLQQAAQRLPASYPTLAQLLQQNAYHTVGFCNNPMVGILDNDLRRGFDAFYTYAGATPNRPADTRRSRPLMRLNRQFEAFARQITNRFATSDALFRAALHPLIVPLWTRHVNFKGNTARSIDDLIAYYERHQAGGAQQPLFAFVNLMGAHMPYHPPGDVLGRVAPHLKGDRQARRFMAEHNADAAAWISPVEQPLDDWQRAVLEGYYDAEIAHQDAQLGRLLTALEKSGRLDQTLVIIAADHGDGHGEHEFIGHSFVVYQELVHVPLIVRFPDRFAAGAHTANNVSTRRIFHTILDFAGVSVPTDDDAPNPNADVTGLSLARAIKAGDDVENGLAFAEAFPPTNLISVLEKRQPHLIGQRRLTDIRRGIYDGDHKLAMVGDMVEAAFQVRDDPAEERDLSAQIPNIVALLRDKIDTFVTDVERQRLTASVEATLTDDMIAQMRALGYMD